MEIKILFIIVILSQFACNNYHRKENILLPVIKNKETVAPIDWKLVTECGLKFYIPSNLKEVKVQPIDSCIKDYESENMILSLDVLEGSNVADSYSNLGNEFINERNFKLEEFNANGQQAKIITFSDASKHEARDLTYCTVFYTTQLKSITIYSYGKSINEQESSINIFKSIQFKNDQ